MKNYNSIIVIVILSIFAINVNAEVLIPSDEDKESLSVFLVKNPQASSIFIRDIDDNLTFDKNSYYLKDGIISSNACLLIDLLQIESWDYLSDIYNENDANVYLVESVYQQYGIQNLAKILSDQSEEFIIDFASSKGLELKVETYCKNSKYGTRTFLDPEDPDIFLIPIYLYNFLKGYEQYSYDLMTSLTDVDVLTSWTFDEMKSLSDNYLMVLAEEEKSENELQEKIANLAEQKSKDFVGSLYLNSNVYGSQNFCTLSYSGDDAVAVIGYRLLGDKIITNKKILDWYDQKEITLNYNKNENQFENVFDDIGEAFNGIKSSLEANDNDYCNIFIDYPENLLRLKNAIERDLEGSRILGALFDKSITDTQYAIGQGFDDYEQYNFAYQIDANYKEIKSLESYQISNLSEFNKVQDEIKNIGYSNDTDLSIVLTYLDDLSNAQQQNMDVNEYIDARLKEEQRLAQIAREEEAERQAAFAREYPYTAILTCGRGGGDHLNIIVCFDGEYGVDTELEITNGGKYQMYTPFNLSQAGSEYNSGFQIALRDSFTIRAQNTSKELVLSLKIVNTATGTTLYQDSAAQYGVINVSN